MKYKLKYYYMKDMDLCIFYKVHYLHKTNYYIKININYLIVCMQEYSLYMKYINCSLKGNFCKDSHILRISLLLGIIKFKYNLLYINYFFLQNYTLRNMKYMFLNRYTLSILYYILNIPLYSLGNNQGIQCKKKCIFNNLLCIILTNFPQNMICIRF